MAAAGGKFHLTHELDIMPATIAPADYAKVLHAESALREKSARAFLIENN